ncbi:MAG: hypothetical protein HZA60_00150 [Deltaproteobacteria bacterium]|nr:hypothetical protein [Deltaproteobacteria bacterium]
MAKSREEWMFLLDIAFRSEKDVLGTEFPRLGFELLLLRLVNAPGLLAVEEMETSAPEAASAPKVQATTYAKRTPPPAPPAGLSPGTAKAAEGGVPGVEKGDLSSAVRRTREDVSPEAPSGAKGEVWDALLRNLGGKRKTVLLGLLSQMKGRMEGDELVIFSPHQFVLDRLREEDKWPVLLHAVEEVAGRKLEVRLSVSAEKKSPDPGAVRKEEDRPEKKALSDPLLLEVLREFEGSTVLEVRPAPKPIPPPEPEPESAEPSVPTPEEYEQEVEGEEQ